MQVIITFTYAHPTYSTSIVSNTEPNLESCKQTLHHWIQHSHTTYNPICTSSCDHIELKLS